MCTPRTYPDKWEVLLGKWKPSSGIDKVPCLRAKSLLAFATQSDISSGPKNQQRSKWREMNTFCALQVCREHSDQEDRKGMNKYRNSKMLAFLFQLIVSLDVLFLPPHPLFRLFTLEYRQGIQPGKCMLLQSCPFPLFTHNCPSFLTHLTQLCWLPQGLLIESGQQSTQ